MLACVQMRNLQTDKRSLAKTLEVRQAELSEVNQRLRNALVGVKLYRVLHLCSLACSCSNLLAVSIHGLYV